MTNSKSTKRALVSSTLAVLVCVAMLIGTTFAWFTDVASTAVNRIQSGTLDVALEMLTKNDNDEDVWVNAEGKTLTFKTADNRAADQILWEPGCRYELPQLRIVNNGKLALKYKMIVSGIAGDAKLNEVIEWEISETEVDANGQLTGRGDALTSEFKGFEGTLLPYKSTGTITIKGHMLESAKNEYQGLSIGGIGITVIATQDTVENDSEGPNYDENAVYPVAPTLGNTTVDGMIRAASDTTLGNMSDTASPSASQIEVPAGAVDEDTKAVFSMNLTDSQPASVTYEISLKDTDGNSVALNTPAKVTTNIGANLSEVVVKHSGVAMTEVSGAGDLVDGTFCYNAATGELIICTKSFSPFEISYKFDGVASVNGTAYTTLRSAIAAAGDNDTIVLMKDVSTASTVSFTKKVTLDLNGKTYTYTRAQYSAFQVLQGGNATIKNGTIDSQCYGVLADQKEGLSLSLDNVKINASQVAVLSFAIKSSFNITNCDFHSNYFGVYQNGSTGGNTFVIEKTKITDTQGAGVYISNSTSTVGRQNLTIKDSVIVGPSGVEFKHTNATIENSTLIGTATPTASGSNNNGTCSDGYALAVTTNGVDDLVTGIVTVSGCTFYSGQTTEGDSDGYVFVYKVAEGSSVTIDGETVTDYNTYGGEAQQ